MVITWLWWLALGASVPMLAAPLPVTIRHSSGRRIRFFRRPSVAVPWWAHLLGLAGIPVAFAAADGLGGRDDGLPYISAVAAVSFVLTATLVTSHNRRIAADPSDARDGVRTGPSAGG